MTIGKGYAPLGKSKVIATPDANKNNKPVAEIGRASCRERVSSPV